MPYYNIRFLKSRQHFLNLIQKKTAFAVFSVPYLTNSAFCAWFAVNPQAKGGETMTYFNLITWARVNIEQLCYLVDTIMRVML